MDRNQVREMRQEVEAALKPVCDKYKVAVTVNGGTFDLSSVTYKLELSDIQDGQVLSTARRDFTNYAYSVGLKPEDLDKKFRFKRSVYTIIGLNLNSRKYPIDVKREDGKIFKMTALTVKTMLTQMQVA